MSAAVHLVAAALGLGLARSEVGKVLGVPDSVVYGLEKGKPVELSMERIDALADLVDRRGAEKVVLPVVAPLPPVEPVVEAVKPEAKKKGKGKKAKASLVEPVVDPAQAAMDEIERKQEADAGLPSA